MQYLYLQHLQPSVGFCGSFSNYSSSRDGNSFMFADVLINMGRGWYKSQAVCIDGPCLDSGLVFLLDIHLMQSLGDLAWICLENPAREVMESNGSDGYK